MPAYYDFTPDLLAAFPLTELAAALRAEIDATILDWSSEVRASVPWPPGCRSINSSTACR